MSTSPRTHAHWPAEDLLELALAARSLGRALPAEIRSCARCHAASMRALRELEQLHGALSLAATPAQIEAGGERVAARTLASLEGLLAGNQARVRAPFLRSRALRLVAASILAHLLSLPVLAWWMWRQEAPRGQFHAQIEQQLKSYAPSPRENLGPIVEEERDWSTQLRETWPLEESFASRRAGSATGTTGWSALGRAQEALGRARMLREIRACQGLAAGTALEADTPAEAFRTSFEDAGAKRLAWLARARFVTWRAACGGALAGAWEAGLRLFEGQIEERGAAQTSAAEDPLCEAFELEWALDLVCLSEGALLDPAAPPQPSQQPAGLSAHCHRAGARLAQALLDPALEGAVREAVLAALERAHELGQLGHEAREILRSAWIQAPRLGRAAWGQASALILRDALVSTPYGRALLLGPDPRLAPWLP